jgi:hypothetical protein
VLEQEIREVVQRCFRQPRQDVHGKYPKARGEAPRLTAKVRNRAVVGHEEVTEVVRSLKNDKVVLESYRRRVDVLINMDRRAFPTKRSTHVKLTRPDRVFRGLIGSSRSVTLDAIKAISAASTGCKVTEKVLDRYMQPTTARGIGNVLGGYQIVR